MAVAALLLVILGISNAVDGRTVMAVWAIGGGTVLAVAVVTSLRRKSGPGRER